MRTIRRPHHILLVSLLAVFWLFSSAWADRIVIDIGPSYPGNPSQSTVPGYTAAEAWISGQAPGNNYSGTGNFYDVIGNRFATDKMTISSANVSPFRIQIWTNNQPGGWTVNGNNSGVADIAIDTWLPNLASYDAYTLQHFPGAQSRFDYGINMQAYAAGTPGQAGGGVNNVSVGPVTAWATSFSNANPTGGVVYGGAYKGDAAPEASKQTPVETNMIDYTPQFWGDMNWVVNDPTLDFNNTVPDYLITITFNAPPNGEFDYLWATAKCGNDIVYSAAVPEPGSLALVCSGLLGLLGMTRWRKRKY